MTESVLDYMSRLGRDARAASRLLARAATAQKNRALLAAADALDAARAELSHANEQDLAAGRANGLEPAMLDRLALTPARIDDMIEGLRQVATLPDPIGEIRDMRYVPSGIQIGKMRVPLGVVGIIYEARPNVTADAASLCLKTGNAVILRGSKSAVHSNIAMTRVLASAAEGAGMPCGSIQVVEQTDRESAQELMGLHGLVDVLIPRGGAGLIQSTVENAKVPVIETGIGNCHVYVHKGADPRMAQRIVINAKCQRPSVCNAIETLLIDDAVHAAMLPAILKELEENGVRIHGDERTRALGAVMRIEPATEDDWYTEYLDYEIAVKVVEGLDDAIAHINRYGSMHSEAIVTDEYGAAQRFLNEVDAAAVYVNASTRFTDGAEFQLGAEIGISTQKLHARGPMGLEALTSTKFVLMGNGQIRS